MRRQGERSVKFPDLCISYWACRFIKEASLKVLETKIHIPLQREGNSKKYWLKNKCSEIFAPQNSKLSAYHDLLEYRQCKK